MGILKRLHEKNYRAMQEEAIAPVLQSGEKVVVFGLAGWLSKSMRRFGTWILDESLLQLAAGKQFIVCLTDRRFLLFQLPRKLKTSYSDAVLTLDVPREDVRVKSLKGMKFFSNKRKLTLVLGSDAEIILTFMIPFTSDAEVLCAELPRVTP